MFERDSFIDLDASSSSGDEIIGLLVDEPGMNMLCDIGNNILSKFSTFPNTWSSGTSSPLDYFLKFFDSEIIDTICENSNSYAVHCQDKYP